MCVCVCERERERERDCYCVKKKACHEESGAIKCDVQQKELKP